MCVSWHIPAEGRRGEVVVKMLVRDEISICRDDVEIVVSRKQLTALSDKLYFLDQAFHADARDVVEALCGEE
ncbi:hypothetical protein MOQ72_41630 [Saccharopolyspora sp. K220]|uniref:hypothetical protein n=1 Tax=Saccharopolyspora soli TaxID=2926618 RepID=UPI001F587175|nr:hypothetical protein [Saccharopolyspora soli]MCI2423921.1 hypothetical protein [Saccharopolyspora soli]